MRARNPFAAILRGAVAAALLACLFTIGLEPVAAHADATVVNSCGAQTYPAGPVMPTTQDTTGTLCTKGGSGGGSTIAVSGLTSVQRPNNSTPYAQNSVVCSSNTGATCIWHIFVAGSVNNTGTLSTFTLWKTTANTGTFAVDLYSAAPTVTSIAAGDQAADLGPVLADNSLYMGTYICQTMLPTNDSGGYYACSPQSTGPGGVQFKTAANQLYAFGILRVTSAYTPGPNETFSITTSAYQDH